MRIINVRDGEMVDRNFAARRPSFAVEQEAAGRAEIKSSRKPAFGNERYRAAYARCNGLLRIVHGVSA